MNGLVPADHLAMRGGARRELQPSNSVSVQTPFPSILTAHWMKVAELWGGEGSLMAEPKRQLLRWLEQVQGPCSSGLLEDIWGESIALDSLQFTPSA